MLNKIKKYLIVSVLVAFSLNANAGPLSLLNPAHKPKSTLGGKVIKLGAVVAAVGVGSVVYEKHKHNKWLAILQDQENELMHAQSDAAYKRKLIKDLEKELIKQSNDLEFYSLLSDFHHRLTTLPNYKPNEVNTSTHSPEQEQNGDYYNDHEISDYKPNNILVSPQGDRIDTSTEFPIIQPKTWEEYLTLAQNSTILANNMKNAGRGTKQKGYAAHHIIPATAKEAAIARAILLKHNIDINDSINGVYLPTIDLGNGKGIKHSGKHPDSYSIKISQIINDADIFGGKNQVLIKLNEIRLTLENANGSDKWRDIL